MPFLNLVVEKYIKNNTGREIQIIVFLGIIFSVIPFIFIKSDLFFDSVRWLCYLYLMGAYLRYHDCDLPVQKIFVGFLLSILIMGFSAVFMKRIGISDDELIYYFSLMQSPFMLMAGICCFLYFKKKVFYNRYINRIGRITFACYLFHDHPLVRSILWEKLFKTHLFYESNVVILLLHIMACTVLIFIAAFFLEIVCGLLESRLFGISHLQLIFSKINGVLNEKSKSEYD